MNMKEYRNECINKGAAWCYDNALEIFLREEAWCQVDAWREDNAGDPALFDLAEDYEKLATELFDRVMWNDCFNFNDSESWQDEIDAITKGER